MQVSDLDLEKDYIFTVGHSNISLDDLIRNLQQFGIEAVADVRSQPVSKYSPHFNRNELAWRIQEEGMRYIFLGSELGGRPSEPKFYDEDGHVRYDLWSAALVFQGGISELQDVAKRRRVALLCSEEDPAVCHRHLLIARVLGSHGWPRSQIIHIRSNGQCLADEMIPEQQEMFGGSSGWRSPQSVLHKVRRGTSSSASSEPEYADSWMSG